MEKHDMHLGGVEQRVLQAIENLLPYGVSIQDHIVNRAGYEPSIGSIYAAIREWELRTFRQ